MPSAEAEQQPVVVVGGGFGGLSAALQLAASAADVPVILIEPQERFLFLPLLYELLSQELRRWEVAPSYSELLAGKGVVWLRDRVSQIDTAAQQLRTEGGQQIAYSQLVLATGGKPTTYGIPGVAEHCLGFRSLADVDRLQQLVQQLKQQQRPLQRLAIVGAGASGVELACKLADLLQGAAVLELIEQGEELLPASRSFNREQAQQALLKRDIRLRTGTRVMAVSATAVSLQRGNSSETLSCDGVIWTGGVVGSVPEITPALELDRRGRLPCQSDLRVIGAEHVFAMGDAALCPDASGDAHPATAQVAYQQATCVAANLLRQRRGEELQPFIWNDLGEMLGLGIGHASLTGMGITLAGAAAFQLRRLAYLARMPGLQHQLRVAGGWLADWF
ncbi:NAD(P)/FAD-dependent oxidoreductase [Synechococcus sp. CB0101]|uniref:NAD(P)/FAD-dependent oxidoreductase n=1 Tax=Synechococcus sp. CB0101 TaxID=232348 RepID=UPI0002002816|nr:FAD-dependent oxidoreductase [Synechococcus sp. CB0101]